MEVLYPNGMSSFEKIRLGNYIYIDKTSYIVKMLASKGSYYFLSRPRRFGKSLFTSTLEAFFQGKRELFKGLAIDSYADWDWAEYPMIRIDFAPKNYSEEGALRERIDAILKPYEERYGMTPHNPNDAEGRFEFIIHTACQKTGRQVVVLVDEYEKPVVDNLDNAELMERNRALLAGFYSVLKANDANLKFVFLTGVTKFGQMSVFSGLNNIEDISLDDEYASICGITEAELLSNFQHGISELAKEEEVSEEEAIAILKRHYDGYHFSKKSPDIYNPYSIILAMKKRAIDDYWVQTGKPTLLVKVLLNKKYDPKQLNGVKVHSKRLLGVDNQFDDPVALFYQTGYLTIKAYNKKLRLYTLGFPNEEVESAFFDSMLPEFTHTDIKATSSVLNDITEGFETGRPEMSISALQSFTAIIPYDILDKIQIEQHFEDVIYIILRAIFPYFSEVKAEERTSDGRTDITVKTEEYIYIIELKIDSTAEEALRQIDEKEYALPYRHDPRKVFLIGINFSTEKRRIDGYKIVTPAGFPF